MILKKTFKFRLKPNCRQENLCNQFAGARRFVYNRALAKKKEVYEKEKKNISLFDFNRELTTLKKQEETAWLKEIHSQVLQQSLQDLDLAYEHFFRRVKNGEEAPGYPRFKCKGDNDSFRYPQGVKVKNHFVWLPKIGWTRFKKSREIKGEIKQTTVIKEAKNWYVCFSCEYNQEEIAIKPQTLAGIDLGIEFFATVTSSLGEWSEDNPRFLNSCLSHLQFLSRQLSKKTKGSKGYAKAKAKLRSFHLFLRNQRQDFLHKLSTGFVKSHDAIAVESLNIKSMLEDSCKGLARSISDASWRSFLQMLQYKCEQAGKKLIETAKFFPSSQICSACQAKQKLRLNNRSYKCLLCGLELHRDKNASRNIWAAGMSVIKACGAADISRSAEAGILRL